MRQDLLTECRACGLLQRHPELPTGGVAECARCGCTLRRNRPDSLNRTLALTSAGIVLFLVATGFPFLSFEIQGQATQTTLLTGVIALGRSGDWPIAAVVLFTSILAPGLQLALLLAVLIPLALRRAPPWLPRLYRWSQTLAPWGMMDVFLLGILVSAVKLSEMAIIVPGASLFAFAVLILVLAAAQATLDPELVWSRMSLTADAAPPPQPGGEYLACAVCGLIMRRSAALREGRRRCPRCQNALHRRKPRSVQRAWALTIAAALLYFPANLLPIMTMTSLGYVRSDTIVSGVVLLLDYGMWPLALVVFIASVVVPLLKLLILILLLLSVRWRWRWRARERTWLYRLLETIGRWSMVDIFVVTILVALVRLGNLATVQAEAGALFFCAVVVLTMLAARSFDPRLIWDILEQESHVRDAGRSRANATPAPG